LANLPSDHGAFRNLVTGIAIEATELGTRIGPGDLRSLRRGFLAGLGGLPDCRVEAKQAESVGDLITLEARLTFRDRDTVRKRWTRLLYQGRTQLRLVAQAASVELFDYWEPMFFEAMRTVKFGTI
jgi:hypothetical protein